MYLNLNPDAIGVHGLSLEELVPLAKKHGFEGIDLPGVATRSLDDAKRAADCIGEAGLQWGLFWLPCDFAEVADAEYEEKLRLLKTMLPCVREAGCKRTYNHIWSGHNARDYEANFQHHVRRLRPLTELLGEYDVQLGLEFLGPKTLQNTFRFPFVCNLPQIRELADAIGPQTGIVLDCFHWYCSGGTLTELQTLLTAERLVNVHANDALPDRPREAQYDDQRALPMTYGVVDLPAILALLKAMDYRGPIIAEPFQPEVKRLSGLPAEEALAEVGTLMTRLCR